MVLLESSLYFFAAIVVCQKADDTIYTSYDKLVYLAILSTGVARRDGREGKGKKKDVEEEGKCSF